MKTIAFEISEQLTSITNTDTEGLWITPDWYVQAVSGGMGPLGVAKGFSELQKMGLTERIPALAVIQADGCSPMVNSWKEGKEVATAVTSPRTHIETLATGDPGRSYSLLRDWVIKTNGTFESVSDEEAFRAMHVIAKMEGISIEPAAAVAFAGLFKLVRAGRIKPNETIVINCTGHTMPAEAFILGDNWSRNVDFSTSRLEDTPEEGLLAALSRVAPDRFPIVAIIDDSSDARRLVRRILQSQGDFKIIEAENGKVAIELFETITPDLIILDLMMPEVDGFGVLDLLKSKPETMNIPIIVSTAKELTKEEKFRLKGKIQALLQKGDFMSDDFLEEVQSLIR
jgi:threonine synthase